MRSVLLLALAVAGSLSGCRCEEEHPYTPFQVSSTAYDEPLPSTAPSPSTEAPETPAPFKPVEALAFTDAEQREWKAAELVVRPPKGQRLDRGFAADLNGDGPAEAVAWTVPIEKDGAGTGGQLWLFAKDAAPAALTGVPPFVPSGPGCRTEARLFHSGPRTATLDIQARCEAAFIARAPTRAVMVLAPREERPVVLTLRVADPAAGESLTLAIDSEDRDEDGRDDVRLKAALHTGEAEREAHVDFVWLDRAAGLARDPAQPKKAFEDFGSVEVVRAKGPKTSQAVGTRIENARRLYASLCAESGVARLFDGEGSPLPCGDLRRAFEWYAEAEILSALTLSRPREALGAYLRASWFHAPLDEKADRRLLALVDSALPSTPAEAKIVPVRASQRGSGPRWSPLRFDREGMLLVLTPAGIERFDANGEPLGSAEEEIDPWPLTVIGPGGNRWGGLAFSCDRSEALFLTSSAEGTPLPAEPVRLLSPRPGGCKGGQFPDVPIPTPLVWEEDRRMAIVAGNVVAPLAQANVDLPEGRWFAAGTRAGLLVFGRAGARRWDAAKPSELADCVVSANGSRVACVRGTSSVTLLSGLAPGMALTPF